MKRTTTHTESHLRRCARRAAAMAAMLLAAACASGPYTAEMLAEGGAQLNPTFDKQPSAVNVRVFRLIDRAAFDNANEADLRAEKPVLTAGAWVAPHGEHVVYVGQKSWIPVEIKPEVKFVGVFGLFNEDTGTHRRVLTIDELKAQKLVFDGFQIAVEPRGKGDTK